MPVMHGVNNLEWLACVVFPKRPDYGFIANNERLSFLHATNYEGVTEGELRPRLLGQPASIPRFLSFRDRLRRDEECVHRRRQCHGRRPCGVVSPAHEGRRMTGESTVVVRDVVQRAEHARCQVLGLHRSKVYAYSLYTYQAVLDTLVGSLQQKILPGDGPTTPRGLPLV